MSCILIYTLRKRALQTIAVKQDNKINVYYLERVEVEDPCGQLTQDIDKPRSAVTGTLWL